MPPYGDEAGGARVITGTARKQLLTGPAFSDTRARDGAHPLPRGGFLGYEGPRPHRQPLH